MLRLLGYGIGVQPMMDTPDDLGGGSGAVQVTGTSTPEVKTDVIDGGGAQPNNTALEFEIDGIGKVKPDDIKEWRQGYMRQSDYTRKTQEVARQRQETKEALELYNFLKSNPHVAQQMQEGDYSGVQNNPMFNKVLNSNPQYEDLSLKVASIELDNMLNGLKSKYADFNEVDVLTKADELNMTNLEDVYFLLKGRQTSNTDIEATLRRKIEAELTEKIRQNGIATQTIIDSGDSVTDANYGLSDIELAICSKMNLSPEQYAKGKNR